MPHVLLLFEYPTLNGGERSLLSLIGELRRGGYRVTAAAPAAGPLAGALHSAQVAHFPLNLRRDLSQTDRRRAVAHAIESVRPALVHANSVSMSRLAGPVCQIQGVPSIGHLRDMLKLSAAAIRDIGLNTRLLAVSHATRRWFEDLGAPRERVHVMYNGVDLNTFRPRAATKYLHEQLHLAPETVLLGSIGQIGMRKGLDLVLRAAKAVLESHSACHILIVGKRHSAKKEAVEYEQKLRRFSETQLSGRVHFLGVRDDVDRILSELTILIHLARQEPLGRVLLEAAAAGCCVLTTDVGGSREIFPADSGAAYVIPAENVVAARRAIIHLLEDGDFRRQLGDKARQRAECAFNLRHVSTQLLRHYNAVLALSE